MLGVAHLRPPGPKERDAAIRATLPLCVSPNRTLERGKPEIVKCDSEATLKI